jgi:hypothetical protein
MKDQVVILEAILRVRAELDLTDRENWTARTKVILRLVTLYSLLDVKAIKAMIDSSKTLKRVA